MGDHGVEKGAERSSFEIKSLIRKLHPDRGNHNDRIRRLNKFRNYVLGEQKGSKRTTPEFYDDDIPVLLLGSAAPSAFLDPDDEVAVSGGYYGLMQACGTPSAGEHSGTLKRSARHGMNVLKWLVSDWKESQQAKPGDNNLFATAFLSLSVESYQCMRLALHVVGDDRGGAKEDACQLIVLILTKHTAEDGSTLKPVSLEELLTSPKAQQEFELWSARHITATVQDVIKKNAAARQAELALQQRQAAAAGNKAAVAAGGLLHDEDALLEDTEHGDHSGHGDEEESAHEESDRFPVGDEANDALDVMAAMRRRRKNVSKELREAETRGEIGPAAAGGVVVRWEDSLLAREQRARAASAARVGIHETVRDSQKAAQEAADRQEEKARIMGKDPLGVIVDDSFDLRNIEASQAEQMEQALQEMQEFMVKAESVGNETVLRKAALQKESLAALVDRMGGMEAMENASQQQYSVLPSSPKFDPILYLTLVHRTANYDVLVKSLDKLSSKADTQVEQLQNLVRDNFPLFVRCAEGFEQFRTSSQNEIGMGGVERIDKLEAIAESSAFQAKRAFKPLLDNTSEVRKVQSAMTVLQRIGPILQVPTLMRQHIENKRYSQALKTFRRVLVIDDSCRIDLLLVVKQQAEQCVRDARLDLERRLAQATASEEDLLDGIRDLSELLDLDIPNKVNRAPNKKKEDIPQEDEGIYNIGGSLISIRGRPPALACLLFQSAHFSVGVKELMQQADEMCHRIFEGESLTRAKNIGGNEFVSSPTHASMIDPNSIKGAGNQWKYDILDARVLATIKAVDMARVWLPRLVQIGKAAREDEKRRAARQSARRKGDDNQLRAFEVFVSNVSPLLLRLVEHASFCALGSNTRPGGKDIGITFGRNTPDKLRTLLRSPLPPSQSTKVGKELAELVELLSQSALGAVSLRPENESSTLFQLSPLEDCKALGESSVITIEKRRCLYAFDVCARTCSNRASGSGKFDADALLSCLQNLSEQLSRPEECSQEVEKGCELVIRRCCEGLASFVRDRGDGARLSAVAECADVMANRISDLVREAAFLTQNSETIHAVMMEDIVGLESAMFDEYLENIRGSVSNSVQVGWLDKENESIDMNGDGSFATTFPAYLSASLLAIVRCRAQVEQVLGGKVRKSAGVPYQQLALGTVADAVVEGICNEVLKRKVKLKVRQADRLANELEFLKNSLKKFLGKETLSQLDLVLSMVSSKAGRGRDYQGDGPDGLAALEELERLGRVYVLCLGGD